MRVQCAGGQVHSGAALAQHAGFGRQHIEVVAQPGLVTLHGNVVGRLGRRLRSALLGLLAGNGLNAGKLVACVMHRVNHCGVVAFHRRVQLSRLAAQVGAQAASVKNRQTQRGTHADLLAARRKQTVQSDAGKPRKRDQVDVGIKLGFGVVDITGRGFDPPAGGCHVGAATQQICWDGRRQRHTVNGTLGHQQRSQGGVGLGDQGRQRMAAQHDLLLQLLNLQPCLRQAAFALAQLQPRVQASAHTVSHQLQGFLPLGQCALGHPHLLVQAQQAEIGARDLAGQ